MRIASVALAALAACPWLFWLARGRANGKTKSTAFRATLLAAIALLVWFGPQLFPRRRIALEVALLLAAAILLAYLYIVRFCPSCGLMQRNLKPATCVRCGAALPQHGMTSALRRTGDEPRRAGRFLGPPRKGPG